MLGKYAHSHTATTGLSMIPRSQVDPAKGNLLQVRTYDVMITYDKYYQTPRIWLIGYDEVCPAPRFQSFGLATTMQCRTVIP